MSYDYIAFISYRHKPLDIRIAARLHRLIEQYRLPRSLRSSGRSRLGRVFRDKDELPVSVDLTSDIRNALDHSQFLIVVCTPDTPGSVWVNREIEYFLQHHDRSQLLAVLAAGSPELSFPKLLTRYTALDGSEVCVEPLAADITSRSTSGTLRCLTAEKLRLFAALLGCSYDTLRQRERARRQRKVFLATVAALAVTGAFAAMLTIKNRQLAAQNQQLLLRESLLLTESAEQSLENGEYLQAAIAAAQALQPPQNGSRLYVAAAERALLEALDVYRNRQDQSLVSSTVLEQQSPIRDFLVTADGNRAITLDQYGMVHCFDTETALLLWTAQPIRDEETRETAFRQLYFGAEETTLLCCGGNGAVALRLTDGSVLWNCEIGSVADGYALSPDGSLLLCVGSELVPHSAQQDWILSYRLYGIATADGSVVVNAELGGEELYFSFDKRNDMAGVFSADGTQFYTICRQHQTTDSLDVLCIDLATGDVRLLYCYTTPSDISWISNRAKQMLLTDDNQLICLVYAASDGADTNEATPLVLAIEPTTGEPLWQTALPALQDAASAQLPWHMIQTKTIMMADAPAQQLLHIAVEDQLYCLRVADGFLAARCSPGSIASLFAVENAFFGVTTEDGFCCYGIVLDSYGYGASGILWRPLAQPVQASQAGLWYNGFPANTAQKGTAAAMQEGETGMLVLVPDDADNTLVLRRTVYADLPAAIAPTCAEPLQAYSVESAVRFGDGRLLIGPVSKQDDTRCYAVLDPAEQTLTPVAPPRGDRFYPLANGGWVTETNTGDEAVVHKADGSTQTLVKYESEVLTTTGNIQWVASTQKNASSVQSETGRLLTAGCDGTTLRLWLDGEPLHETALPQQLQWYAAESIESAKLLNVGPQGTVILGGHPDEDTLSLSCFAVYDVAVNRWQIFPDAATGSCDRSLCFALTDSRFAVADADGCIRIYDPASPGQEPTVLAADIDAVSVDSIHFVLQDTVLLVVSKDARLTVLDSVSGAVLARLTLPTDTVGSPVPVTVTEDPDNQRLYLCFSAPLSTDEPNALCLSTSTWEVLAEINRFLAYLPQNNSMLCKGAHGELQLLPIPTLAQLLQTMECWLQ